MDWKKIYQRIETFLELMSKWAVYIGATILLVGLVAKFFKLGNSVLFAYITDNIHTIWLSTITVIALTSWLWVSRLNNRFTSRFKDNFSKNLNTNWDFVGRWLVAENYTLLVTGSDKGGITKVGANWENYTFSFDARIKNKCLGVIIRAQDLDSYYMFQIHADKIRPHRRISQPVIEEDPSSSGQEKSLDTGTQSKLIKFRVAWQILESHTPINPPLSDWFTVKIIARGESVWIYIGNELMFHKESFLKIPMGKVGFRNSGKESALVRNVKVVVQP